MPITISGSTGIAGVDGSASTPAVQGTDTNTGIAFPAADTVAIGTGGTERMRVDSSGNVGIGTSSPQSKLSVSNGGAAGLEFYANYPGGGVGTYIQSYNRSTSAYVNTGYEAAQHAFFISGSERMRIDSSGNVGIGTSSPLQKLDVSQSSRLQLNVADPNVVISYTNAANNAFQAVIHQAGQHNFRYGGTDKFIVDVNRAYCVNNSGSRAQNGPVVTSTNDSVGALVRQPGYIEMNTDVGGVGVNYFLSDERKKDNIQPSVFSSSALISQIQFISFDWKPDSGNAGHVDAGVSAQQLRSIDARLVNELSDGSLMVSEPALVSHIAKALQEALTEIASLKARLTALEAK